jgi:2-hydroxychromene-2-carboxylate isomerase
VNDGYSHLAIQALGRLSAAYDVDLVIHLVRAENDNNTPEPGMLTDLSRRDSSEIAPYLGFSFPKSETVPSERLIRIAESILSRMDKDAFVRRGAEVSETLWRGDEAALEALLGEFGPITQRDVEERVARGNARRAALKHYSGAMFYYEGEWYWGVDRLSHLERRLRSLSAQQEIDAPWVAPKQSVAMDFPIQRPDLTLEYFVSPRSPYTAISWAPTLALVKASGVRLKVRPVLPMVMRGVPATFEKAFYVWKDAYREALDFKVEFGDFYDPIGKPIEQIYSLYMWAIEKDRGSDLLGSFLTAAFAKGINTNTVKGMQTVVEMAGLRWDEARHQLNNSSWRELVEINRKSLYACGIWGVPSYRLLDKHHQPLLETWGQDRLWLVSRKLKERPSYDS